MTYKCVPLKDMLGVLRMRLIILNFQTPHDDDDDSVDDDDEQEKDVVVVLMMMMLLLRMMLLLLMPNAFVFLF